uniref:Uncharacterized protein n=1 Tax=Oryza sativa subsp. japonica TaxID=39947 RepID=Q8LMV7_ORYSJ|nr:hypothetical protein [Oryza sativa Japonica Group]
MVGCGHMVLMVVLMTIKDRFTSFGCETFIVPTTSQHGQRLYLLYSMGYCHNSFPRYRGGIEAHGDMMWGCVLWVQWYTSDQIEVNLGFLRYFKQDDLSVEDYKTLMGSNFEDVIDKRLKTLKEMKTLQDGIWAVRPAGSKSEYVFVGSRVSLLGKACFVFPLTFSADRSLSARPSPPLPRASPRRRRRISPSSRARRRRRRLRLLRRCRISGVRAAAASLDLSLSPISISLSLRISPPATTSRHDDAAPREATTPPRHATVAAPPRRRGATPSPRRRHATPPRHAPARCCHTAVNEHVKENEHVNVTENVNERTNVTENVNEGTNVTENENDRTNMNENENERMNVNENERTNVNENERERERERVNERERERANENEGTNVNVNQNEGTNVNENGRTKTNENEGTNVKEGT